MLHKIFCQCPLHLLYYHTKCTRLLGRAMAKQLVAGFWPLNPEFDHWPFHVGLTVDNVALRFFPTTSVSSLSIGGHVLCNLLFMSPTLYNLSKWQGPSVHLKRRGHYGPGMATPERTTALGVHKLVPLIFLSVEFSLDYNLTVRGIRVYVF